MKGEAKALRLNRARIDEMIRLADHYDAELRRCYFNRVAILAREAGVTYVFLKAATRQAYSDLERREEVEDKIAQVDREYFLRYRQHMTGEWRAATGWD